jgi:hypothetical protein
LKLSAVAAHHCPRPAFQNMILDRACLGNIPKGPYTQVVARKRDSIKNAPF